jgi:hypothetical protein
VAVPVIDDIAGTNTMHRTMDWGEWPNPNVFTGAVV